MTRDELKQKLQRPYDRTAWQGILRELFSNVSVLSQPHSISYGNEDVKSFIQLGHVQLHDGKNLTIFEVKVEHRVRIPQNRVKLRNLVARYIDQQTSHGVLVFFTGQNQDYRFTFAAKDSEFAEDGTFVEQQTATKRFTYLLGPHESCTTAAQRLLLLAGKKDRVMLSDVVEAFSVEKLNKEFFTQYKEHYSAFVSHLLTSDAPQRVFGIPRLTDEKEQDKANKPVRDFAKRLLGRLVFLHFLQKKGWLGCPADRSDWVDGDRDFVRNLLRTCPNKEKFFSSRLVPLFFEALNRHDRSNALFPVTGTRVPYLNGGLFEREQMPNDHKPLPVDTLDFPSALFESLLEFFAQYNFTIDENDPDDHEVGIDPEMLGHIFENLLEDNKDKGAYYTPKPIVQYMCQQSLIHYLQQHLGEKKELLRLVRFKDDGPRNDRNSWVRQNARCIEELLDRLKICDPAIGSGAFPIGLLQEIYWIKLTLDWTLDPAETKLKIIQNSIYGVDIDAGAVEIARLRFWLALIVDENEPRPLPNLDYKIMQGDSLLESFEGIPLDKLHAPVLQTSAIITPNQMTMDFAESQPMLTATAKTEEITDLTRRYFGETDPIRKQELHREIDRFVLSHIDYNLRLAEDGLNTELHHHRTDIVQKRHQLKIWKPTKKTEKRMAFLDSELKAVVRKKAKLRELEEKPERPYFLWHLFYKDVFEHGGFDIVIANPPYVSVEKFSRTSLQEQWKKQYQTYASRCDIYCFFYERGIHLLNQQGVLCYISSNKFMRAGYGEGLRKLLVSQTVEMIIDFCELPVFAAATDPAIMLLRKAPPTTDHRVFSAVIKEQFEINRLVPALNQRGVLRPQASLSFEGWTIEGQDALALLGKLRSKGTPLGKYVGGRLYYGIKTGLNEAFIIDQETRDRLVKEDPKSSDLIKPWLRGRELYQWKSMSSGMFVIQIGYNDHKKLDSFPAIKKHLSKFERQLKTRGQCQNGQHHWLELDNNPSPEYLQAFDDDKIIFADIGKRLKAIYDTEKHRSADTTFWIPGPQRFLLPILLSKSLDWYYRMTFQSLGDPWRDGRMRFKAQYMKHVPIPNISNEKLERLTILSMKAASSISSSALVNIEKEINYIIYSAFDLLPEEIELIERSVPQPETLGGLGYKAALFTHIIPTVKDQSAYFSLEAIKRALTEVEIELAAETLWEYMSEAMASGVVADAGRGWYSRHVEPVGLDPKPVAKLIRAVEKAFPLLDFCCWSTVQFNPFAQHLIAQPTMLLYADGDTLKSVAGNLRESGWNAWANPNQGDVEQFVRPGEKTVVLRPAISKQPEADGHVAPIEKALVDLMVEAPKLRLMDPAEAQRILNTVLHLGLIQLSVLLAYSLRREQAIESAEITN